MVSIAKPSPVCQDSLCTWCGKPLIGLKLNQYTTFVCDNFTCQLFRTPQRYILSEGFGIDLPAPAPKFQGKLAGDDGGVPW